MKLQDQCCTRPQAEKLRELGISQDAYFVINPAGEVSEAWSVEGTEDNFRAAFTVAELGQAMPVYYGTIADNILKTGKRVYPAIRFVGGQVSHFLKGEHYENEAQARATMLIRLLESKTITPSDVNARLKG